MKTNKTIDQLFKEEQSKVAIPTHEEFRILINQVTKQENYRNSTQKGTVSPFGIFIRMSKNKLILAGSLALLAIIVIIPSVYHEKNITQVDSIVSTGAGSEIIAQAAISIGKSAQGSPVEDIAADIIADLNEENLLIEQEFNSEVIITDEGALFDDITT